MEEPNPESISIKRHRWSALWNGVIIGMGFFSILYLTPLGALFLAVGIIMEIRQRKRLDRAQ